MTNELLKVENGDVNIYVHQEGDQFSVTASQGGALFYEESFPTLAEALTDLHRFLMAEYAHSVYVRNDEEQKAFAAFA